MSSDGNPTVAHAPRPKKRKHQNRQLRVVFDTNVLYIGSASDLVRQEVGILISESKFPDLEIQWYLPEVVRHERQYQMQTRALELLGPIARVQKLLGHNLAITETTLLDSVEKAVRTRQDELQLITLKLEPGRVDWDRLTVDAAYRRPPFQPGEKEKGFRDALIIECFCQLAADSPKTPKSCRIVLVSGDILVTQAAQLRIASSSSASVLSSVEELKGLINTLVSQVDEDFLASLKPKAEKLFFVEEDEATLLYKEGIQDKLMQRFKAELSALPPGARSRKNGEWMVNSPNFTKKTGQRIQWTTRIDVEAEASKTIFQPGTLHTLGLAAGGAGFHTAEPLTSKALPWPIFGTLAPAGGLATLSDYLKSPPQFEPLSPKTVTTHRGIDGYDVLWSVEVTTTGALRRPSIDDMSHAEMAWEQVS